MMRVIVSSLLVVLLLVSCATEEKVKKTEQVQFNQRIFGKTQGTTYEIKFIDSNTTISKKQIDSILHDFDLELSGYIDNSILSKVNRGELVSLPKEAGYFKECFTASANISKLTDGFFDPTVFPLVKAWGFFNKPYQVPSDEEIERLMASVGFDKLSLRNDSIFRQNNHTTLDFNAIAQGYSVDVLGDYLKSKGYSNYYIEIGGEVLVNGLKNNNEPWYLAIDYPSKSNKKGEGRMAKAIIAIDKNKAVATSGNYRKVFEYQGKEYGHSLNPKTGRPAENTTRSVTVIGDNCMDADAYATAFMIMGYEKSLDFITTHDSLSLEAYFLYDDGDGIKEVMTNGFKNYLQK